MDRRVGQLAGLLAASLVILRLGRLMQSGPEFINWQLILVASVILGGVVWWLLGQLLNGRWLPIVLFGLGALALFLRISVGETLNWVIPTAETSAALLAEMQDSARLVRFGVPPIEPEPGVVAILAVLMWIVGALYAWGLTGGPVSAMILPSLILYLQFAVFDRERAGTRWLLASATLLALAVVALGLERRSETGRARDASGRPLPRRSSALALVTAATLAVVAVFSASSASTLVSEYGNVPWRSEGTGYGFGGGGTVFNALASLQQHLVDLPEDVMFRARLGDDAPPAGQLYWPMETLDRFDGEVWRPTRSSRPYQGGVAGDPDHRYQGTTSDLLVKVRIDNLRGEIAPTIGGVSEIHPIDDDGAVQPAEFRNGLDGSLVLLNGLAEGDTYQVRASYPEYQQDFGALATDDNGELSPLFASAVDSGILAVSSSALDNSPPRPDDLDFYLDLPDLPSDLTSIARAQTAGATTDFERAFMLESWFRAPGNFTYSTAVTTGHSSLDLVDWLTDTDSLNYRTGYCQQFASSMAVLGRALGIPSRVVWGFTPGNQVEIDGAEFIEIRGTNAHAWVEMWLDPVGWVRFDPTPRGDFVVPTAGFDPAELVQDIEVTPDVTPNQDPGVAFLDEPPLPLGDPGTVTGPRWWLIGLLGAALLLPIVPTIKNVRRRRRLAKVREGDITAAWDEIVDRLTDLGEPVAPTLTPMEFAATTDAALMPLAVNYSAAVYGGRPGQADEMDLLEVEGWLNRQFTASERARASLALKSLFKRY